MELPVTDLRRGELIWAELDPVRGREQAGRRPVLVIAGELFLEKADTLVIVVPATAVDRGWPNHVQLQGPNVGVTQPTFAMTEQLRTITRDRIGRRIGVVDLVTIREVDSWLRDFLELPRRLVS